MAAFDPDAYLAQKTPAVAFDPDAYLAAQVIPSEIPAARKEPGFMTQLGRGAASLADVTVGGVLPAVAQQVAYPIARLGRTPEQAQAATQRIIGAVDQPFGKAFGVSETPEYQQEAGRKVLDFIGQNFQKGSKWLSEKTGIAQPDIENLIGTATVAAPTAVKAIREVGAPIVEKATIAAKMPFEKQLQARREAASLRDYARGPQLDAAAEAQRLGIALNPVDIEPTLGPKITASLAGEKGVEALTTVNKNRVRSVALDDMALPPTTQLNGRAAFDQARSQVAKPYEEVKKLPIQQADDAMIQRLENIRADLDVIGAKEYAPAISKIVDDAISKTQTGLTGESLLKNISVLRERARKTYNNKAATTEALDIADTNLKVATELESLIDNSISNPKLLQEYRDARQKMARTYAYEGATDFNTGIVDVKKLARITSKDSALTGNIASLGKIAGNFPEVFTTKAVKPLAKVAAAIGRTGAAGTLGGLAGYALGQDYASAAIGSVLGAGAGKLGESVAARRMASPGYQAGLQLRDMRIPVNQLASSMQPSNALVTVPPEVFGPSGAKNAEKLRVVSYDENGVPIYAAEERGQGFTMPAQPYFGAEPTPYAQRSITNEVPRQVYEAQKRAELAQEYRAKAERKPTTGEILLDLDPITGKLVPASAGIKGATPNIQVIESTGKSLKSASEKLSSGKSPALLSSEERIAWNKTTVDLAEALPQLQGLSDKAVANKMMDRQWIQETINKLREQDRIFNQLAQQSATNRAMSDAANQAALKREKMLLQLMELQDTLRSPRPVQKGGQGPKTRAFQRNELIPPTSSLNELAP